MVLGVAMAETPRSFRFAFGAGDVPDDFVLVSPDAGFGKEYGFDLGTRPVAGSGFVTSDKPSYFSVAVPEGNYNVTVKLGDPAGDCVTTVKAEPRRLMLEHVHTAAGGRRLAHSASMSGVLCWRRRPRMLQAAIECF